MSGTTPPARPRRFPVPRGSLERETILFGPEEAHHMARVLRLRPGARVVAFDGSSEAEVDLLTVGDRAVTARRVGGPRECRRSLRITLLQGIARGPKMDLIVRMATEIGVAAVAPVVTSRSLPDPGRVRLERWARIAQEAAKQCGRADLLEVRAPASLADALAAIDPADLLIVPWEMERRPIGDAIAGVPFDSATLLIGPEGGLSEEEVLAARAAGCTTVSLGPLILRTETAGLVSAAMLLYERLLRPGGMVMGPKGREESGCDT